MGIASGLNFKSLKLTASELQAAGHPEPILKTQNDARGAASTLPVRTNPTACKSPKSLVSQRPALNSIRVAKGGSSFRASAHMGGNRGDSRG